MGQSFINIRMVRLMSSTIQWFASFIRKDRHEGDRESNWTEINKSVSHEEVDKGLFEEFICNASESRLMNEHCLPTIDVEFSKNPQIKVGARVLQDENGAIYDPNASESNSISVKGTPDEYIENYMKNGIEEEELLKVVKTQLPDNFHGMILEEDIQKQKKNGSYLIRFRENKNGQGKAMEIDKKIDQCAAAMEIDEEGEKKIDQYTSMEIDEENENKFDRGAAMETDEEGEKKIDQGAATEKGDENIFDHCTAMIIENDYKEYFDPAGKVPLNFINFFTHYNSRQVQSSEYNTCAFHCFFYLVYRYKGFTMDQLSAFYPGNLKENDKMVTEKFTKFEQNNH